MEEEIDYKREYEVKELQLHLLREEKDNKIKRLERYINNRCIPISLIEKKIEELENKYIKDVKTGDVSYLYHNQFIVDCVAILQELLDERNNKNDT